MKNIDGNILFSHKPEIVSYASVVGKKESEGPLRDYFDRVISDAYAGKDTFEQAESELTGAAVRIALNKGGLKPNDIDIACCGDLLNQCVASSFAMSPFKIPYAGVYGACSTMALSMIMAGVAVDSGASRRAVCAASSHYCTAERQYRFPLEYGSQRPPTAQWTVTGAGACILEDSRLSDKRSMGVLRNEPASGPDPASGAAKNIGLLSSERPDRPARIPRLYSARIGRIVDYNITDQNNMGAAMAPANVR